MKWVRCAFLLTTAAMAIQADELHLRNGTVILGAYVGGTQKEIYFQRTSAGSDMYPVFLVESVKFNSVPSLAATVALRVYYAPDSLAARIKSLFALLLPPQMTAQLDARR